MPATVSEPAQGWVLCTSTRAAAQAAGVKASVLWNLRLAPVSSVVTQPGKACGMGGLLLAKGTLISAPLTLAQPGQSSVPQPARTLHAEEQEPLAPSPLERTGMVTVPARSPHKP